VNVTSAYGFPFPECDPPLIKDASQAAQIRVLAEEIDQEVTRIADLGDRVLNHPDTARLTQAALSTATTENLIVVPLDTVVFNSGLALSSNGIQLSEAGWWLAGGYASVDCATPIEAQVRLTLDGTAATSWSNPGGIYSTIFQLPFLSAPLLAEENAILRLEIKHSTGGSPSWNYRGHLWVVKVIEA
jgi:hypothetical protein